MPNIPGADVRQSPYASKLASLEPEGIPALALAALALPVALASFLSTVEGVDHG
ncbi:MAG: hypothetical protein V5B39_12585 [Accumulibacter sp.]|jgi:hypothetical protein|uniref:hypothetical protein n=1 Tax=Accumulibacter sp. TaxID=2053492 RepID=UPI002FC3B9AD